MKTYSDLIDGYSKVKKVIESCVTENHIKTSKKMFDNFWERCVYSSLNVSLFKQYVDDLRIILKSKSNNITH